MNHHQFFRVSAALGTLCRDAGLKVEYVGREASIEVFDAKQKDTFWACRLAYLRENPNAD